VTISDLADSCSLVVSCDHPLISCACCGEFGDGDEVDEGDGEGDGDEVDEGDGEDEGDEVDEGDGEGEGDDDGRPDHHTCHCGDCGACHCGDCDDCIFVAANF
jgi:hypothetical protein